MSTKSKPIDPLAWMRKHLSNVPPTAIAAFERANSARATGRVKPPRKDARMIPLPPAPPKPRAVKTHDEMQASLLAPSVAAHVRAGLKNFKTARAAQDALMTMQDAVARLNGDFDSAAGKYLDSRGLKPLSIATTSSPTSGGYLTPDALTGAIQLRLAEVGAARNLATVVPVVTGQATVPVMTDAPVVYYVSEAEAITDSTPAYGQLGLSVRKRGVVAKVSNDLFSDSAFSMLDTFIRVVANELAAKEDSELVNGDGSSAYGSEVGLLDSLGSAGIATATGDTWAELTGADFAATIGKLPARYARSTNRWLVSSPFWAVMIAALPAAVSYDAQGQAHFMGFKVQRSESMPRATATSTVSALFGAFEDAVTFADHGITFAASDKGPNAFAENLTLLRAVSRYDIVCHNCGTAAAAGAVVGLSTAAS